MSQIVFFLGPPGVGKTALLSELAQDGFAVVPCRPQENPHLTGAWQSSAAAHASQAWFIERSRGALDAFRPQAPLLIEDDPILAPAAYSAIMAQDGLLESGQLSELYRLAQAELVAIRAQGHTTTHVLLDAADSVLLERVRAREGNFDGDAKWIRRIAASFRAVTSDLAKGAIRTDHLTARELAALVANELNLRF